MSIEPERMAAWRGDYVREFGAAFPDRTLPELTDDDVRGLIEAGLSAAELCAEVQLGLAAKQFMADLGGDHGDD